MGQLSAKKPILNKEFAKAEGPFVRGLDEALVSFNVQWQSYYGGTFVGNHVHTALKVMHIIHYLNMFTYYYIAK